MEHGEYSRSETTMAALIHKHKIDKKIKIFIGFVQILSVSDIAFKIPWPPEFISMMTLLTPFNFDFLSFSGLGCLVEYNFYHSFVAMMCMPLFVLLAVFVAFRFGIFLYKRKHGKACPKAMHKRYTDQMVQFTLWVILLVYPPISRRATEYFACSEFIDGRSYLVKDYRIECYTDLWHAVLPVALGAFLLYPLGIPLYSGLQLWRRRRMLNDPSVLARFGFLYDAYRDEAFLWDVWELFTKLFLTGIVILIAPGTVFQVCVVVIVNLWLLIFSLILKPHKKGSGSNLAMMSSTALTMTMLMGLILTSIEDAQLYKAHFSVFLVSMNGFVAAYTVFLTVSPFCTRANCTPAGRRLARKAELLKRILRKWRRRRLTAVAPEPALQDDFTIPPARQRKMSLASAKVNIWRKENEADRQRLETEKLKHHLHLMQRVKARSQQGMSLPKEEMSMV